MRTLVCNFSIWISILLPLKSVFVFRNFDVIMKAPRDHQVHIKVSNIQASIRYSRKEIVGGSCQEEYRKQIQWQESKH